MSAVLDVLLLGALLLAADASSGIALFRDQQFAAAEQALRKALAANPADGRARLYLARTLIELKRIPEALAEIEATLSRSRGPESRFEAGRILRELADRRFAQLQATGAVSPAILELAGARFEWAGNLDEALKNYRAAAAMDPKRPGAHYRVANVLWRKREVAPALEALRQELGLNPHHALANLRMGQALLNENQDAEALPYLERAVAALPDSADARRELGKGYRKTGRLREARTQWELVAKARPDDDQVHYLLSTLYRELGEAGLAKRELELHRALLERRRARAESQQP